MSELTMREQFAAIGSALVKSVPFWYMGVRGAVAEVAERESTICEFMALTGASYEDCAAAVAEHAKTTPYPDWPRFRETTKEALIDAWRSSAGKPNTH